MPRALSQKHLLSIILLGAFTACAMPTEPEGIGQVGMTRLASQLQVAGDDAGAVDLYQRSLQGHPRDVGAYQGLGAIYEKHGQIEAAENVYADGLKQVPDSVDLMYADGRILVRLGRAAEARDVYEKILKDNRHDVKALNGLGISLDYLGQHQDAQNNYRTALDVEPSSMTTMNNLAHSYVLAGQYDQAIALLEPHANDKSATPAMRQNLAEAYGMSGMYADAERMAKIDLSPQDVKKNMAYYRARHAKLPQQTALSVDLGSYATAAIAEMEATKARNFTTDSKVSVQATPEVQTVGGTPSFVVRASGFANASSMNRFCDVLQKNQVACNMPKK